MEWKGGGGGGGETSEWLGCLLWRGSNKDGSGGMAIFQLAGIYGGLFFLELRSGVIEQDRSDGKDGDEF